MHLLLLATPGTQAGQVLPALPLLPHRVEVMAPEPSALLHAPTCDIVLVDGRGDLAAARTTCRWLRATGLSIPLIVVLTEGGMTVVGRQWGMTDFISDAAPPAEIEARFRLATHPAAEAQGEDDEGGGEIESGGLIIDPSAYTVRIDDEMLDLTYKEFELLKYLAGHPGRVFTRAQLLQEVWGYDYYGGTRTVDVHVRRLRAKLGTEYEAIIGTVRGVGYRFDPPRERVETPQDAHAPTDTTAVS